MTDLSYKERERLRQLEEEVEKERVREKKAREEAEAKARALAKIDEPSDDPASDTAKKKAVVKASVKGLQLARESRIQMRNKILVGGGAVMAMILFWTNVVQLIGIAAVLGAGYVGLNKHLVGPEIPDDDDDDSSSGGKGSKPA
jgi:hypothetical protein